jgi:NADH pyrophosphatase NudC (nudix superfamily)
MPPGPAADHTASVAQWKPAVTVAAIAGKDNRFLLVEEYADGLAVFNQPAGHLEEQETLIDAVKREVLEETAWDFQPAGLTGVYLYPNPHNGITYLRFCFHGQCTRLDDMRKLDKEIIRTVWMTREEIISNQARLRSPLVLRSLDDYLSGKSYPLEILNHISLMDR